MGTNVYSFKNDILVTLNFLTISGFSDGDDAVILAPAEDRITTRVGADGLATVALNANELWEVTLKLMDTASSNQILQGLLDAQKISGAFVPVALFIKDAGGTDLFQTSKSWISKEPTVQYGQGANIREWGLQANDVNFNYGGHL